MITNYDVSLVGLVAILIQIVIPMVIAVVTRTSADNRVKAVAVIVLSGVIELLTQYAGSAGFDWKYYLVNTGIGIAISVVAYLGVWKPTGLADQAGKLGPQ